MIIVIEICGVPVEADLGFSVIPADTINNAAEELVMHSLNVGPIDMSILLKNEDIVNSLMEQLYELD